MSHRLAKIAFIIVPVVMIAGVFHVFLQNYSVKEVSIIYPFDGTLFPPDIASPTFIWDDITDAKNWMFHIDFQDGGEPLEVQTVSTKWIPGHHIWESIKERSLEKTAKLTIIGFKKMFGFKKILSKKSFSITTSNHEVGAPIFFRSVPLPFEYALNNMETIKWCLGDIASEEPPRVVLENLPVCVNCHSFSADGKLFGMDVDYADDKGAYLFTEVSEEIELTNEKIISWSNYNKEDSDLTFGLLAQVSPDGMYAISTVKDGAVFLPVDDPYYSQLFFPVKGILAYYDRETGGYHALSGADDRQYVQSNPVWSPDSKYIVFAKNEADSIGQVGNKLVLSREKCEEYLSGEKKFKYDLYRLPFNGGQGGEAKPLEGASGNGMSNYFPRYSPDGKWIVFCKSESYMLLQPDSKLYIMPAEGGIPRELGCNSDEMNSWHSWSPNGRWLVFSSKRNTMYTQLFLTHIDEEGKDSPPVLLSNFITPDRAVNIPEFVNINPGGIKRMREAFLDTQFATENTLVNSAEKEVIKEDTEEEEDDVDLWQEDDYVFDMW